MNYTYPNEVHVSLSTTQYGTTHYFDVSEKVWGSLGFSESPYTGPIKIVGENPWEWKGDPNNLSQADAEKDKAFVDSIVGGKFHNQVALGVESALTAMLGRMAGRSGRVVTWDEMLASNQHYELDVDMSQFK